MIQKILCTETRKPRATRAIQIPGFQHAELENSLSTQILISIVALIWYADLVLSLTRVSLGMPNTRSSILKTMKTTPNLKGKQN